MELSDFEERVRKGERLSPAVVRALVQRVRDAEAERDDLEDRLSGFLCDVTGGLLSKTGYDVRTMVLHTEEYYDKLAADVAAERDAALEVMNSHKCEESAERAYRRAVQAEAERDARQPSEDDREALLNVLAMTDLSDFAGTDVGLISQAADAILAGGFSRAAVPDAATERVTENSVRHVKQLTTELQNKRESLNDQRREFRKLLAGAEAERDAALAREAKVRELHPEEIIAVHESHGPERWCPRCQEHYPCETVRALDAGGEETNE